MVEIREAGLEDVAGIVGLSEALFREDAGSRDRFTNLRWPLEEGREYFSALVCGEDSICLVAESWGEVVGYLAGRLEGGSALRPVKVADLESMCVREVSRSAGVGASLAREFFRRASEKDAQRASVTAYSSNERAINFYRGLGFEFLRSTLELEL